MAIQWPLVIFSLLAGCGGGMLAFLALAEAKGFGANRRFLLAVAALVVAIVGGCASVVHLGNPGNIMAAAANIGSLSGISVELIFLSATCIFAFAYVIALKRGAAAGTCKVLAIIAGVLGVVLAFVTGNGYVMESQANWNTPLLPVCYLASGLTMGGAMYLAYQVAKPDEDESSQTKALLLVSRCVCVLAAVSAVAFLAFNAVSGFSGDVVCFWICAFAVGGVGAAVCAALSVKNAKCAYAAAACAIIGGIGFRCAMWLMGTGFLSLFATIAARGVLGL